MLGHAPADLPDDPGDVGFAFARLPSCAELRSSVEIARPRRKAERCLGETASELHPAPAPFAAGCLGGSGSGLIPSKMSVGRLIGGSPDDDPLDPSNEWGRHFNFDRTRWTKQGDFVVQGKGNQTVLCSDRTGAALRRAIQGRFRIDGRGPAEAAGEITKPRVVARLEFLTPERVFAREESGTTGPRSTSA
jgi:hypothetical protein